MAIPVQHFVIRVGNYSGNWSNRADRHIWGLAETATGIDNLKECIRNNTALVWFMTKKNMMRDPNDGKVVAVARPLELFKWENATHGPSDQDMNWVPIDGAVYPWRIRLDTVIDIADPALTTDSLRTIMGRNFNQRCLQRVLNVDLSNHLSERFLYWSQFEVPAALPIALPAAVPDSDTESMLTDLTATPESSLSSLDTNFD